MGRTPRPASASIIDRKLAVWLGLGGITMAVVTLGIMAYAESRGDALEHVRTLGYVTFSLTHLFAALSYRFPNKSIFSMETFNNSRLNWSLLFSLVAILLPTELGFLQRGMQLASLDLRGWIGCLVLASAVLWVSEGYKWLAYRRSDTQA